MASTVVDVPRLAVSSSVMVPQQLVMLQRAIVQPYASFHRQNGAANHYKHLRALHEVLLSLLCESCTRH
jgi:hypothetical protein